MLIDASMLLIHASSLLVLGAVYLAPFQAAPLQTMSASEKLKDQTEHEGGTVFFGIREQLIRKAMTEGFKESVPRHHYQIIQLARVRASNK
jgi:hypothetical protein